MGAMVMGASAPSTRQQQNGYLVVHAVLEVEAFVAELLKHLLLELRRETKLLHLPVSSRLLKVRHDPDLGPYKAQETRLTRLR